VVAHAANPPPPAPTAPLQRFDAVPEDAEDQHTRIHVPISYEDDEPVPNLRPPVAPRPVTPSWDIPSTEIETPGRLTQLGMQTLQLSRWVDDWLHGQRTVLLVTLAVLCAAIAPLLDMVTHSPRHGATVIASNLVLFFLWTLAFAWLGKLRNDALVWDYRVAFTRLSTAAELMVEDLGRFGRIAAPLRFRALGEFFSLFGLLGLCGSSVLTVSQLVWGTPASVSVLFFMRFSSSVMIVLAAVCTSRAATSIGGLYADAETSAPVVSRFPAIIDLTLPLSLDSSLASTSLGQLVQVLQQWQPRLCTTRDSYQAHLERHLLRQMPWARIERDYWLGELRTDGIAHVMVNQGILLEVVREFDGATADRLSARMRRLARKWRGKPSLIVVFDATRAALLDSDGTPPLQSLHQSYPVLTVRMPTADPMAA
jgi:hypothetical protein